MSRRSGIGVPKPPEAYLPPTSEVTVEDIIDIAKQATTLYDVCHQTRLSRHTVRKVLRASNQYHEVELSFGKDAESVTARIEQLRDDLGDSAES